MVTLCAPALEEARPIWSTEAIFRAVPRLVPHLITTVPLSFTQAYLPSGLHFFPGCIAPWTCQMIWQQQTLQLCETLKD
uniref:Uncharacterized protein n=1 Tax=Anguilla anguilla TaxID=7936 RepID=A0A0E9WKK2_ANGAN